MKANIMNIILFLFIFFISCIVWVPGLPTTEAETRHCTVKFSAHGMNFSSFYKGAAHGIHALSLEEIRYFFKADAPEENQIPTLNTNTDSRSRLLYNAPLWGYSNDKFQTWALKILEFFMLNDTPYFYDTVRKGKCQFRTWFSK